MSVAPSISLICGPPSHQGCLVTISSPLTPLYVTIGCDPLLSEAYLVKRAVSSPYQKSGDAVSLALKMDSRRCCECPSSDRHHAGDVLSEWRWRAQIQDPRV